jgi:gliding motility-associated-like protein
MFGTTTARAQLCTGSLGDRVVKIDFGSGTATHAAALSGTTSYTYSSADFPNDGTYTVENTTAGAGNVWWSTTDHTSQAGGTKGGYMMVVNASVAKTDYFYKSTVTGLCPGTTYEFAAWVVNLLRASDISPPNITFTIYNASDNSVIGTYNTGTIPLTSGGAVWKQYGMYFTTPASVSSVIIQMTNNSNGGAPANDLALDDITFRACGPTMKSSFTSTVYTDTTKTTCAGTNQSYTLTAEVQTGYTKPAYQWQVNTGTAWADIAGATSPSYTLNYQPAVAGTYKYRLNSSEAANAGSAACQVSSNLLTITVTAAPLAAFTYTGSSCLGDATVFTDKSTAPGLTISSWAWDFGDGQASTQQNPSHTYAASGDFPVKLTVTNSGGCSSSSPIQTVHISAKPVAKFTYSTPACAGQPVTLTDQSTTADGSIAQWVWIYGDGSATDTRTAKTPFTHTFTTAGTYTVQLQAITTTGCTSTIVLQDIVIHPLPVVDFTTPDACISDNAPFTNTTTISDNTDAQLIYAWNFGDSYNPGSNTSTLKNPTHHYTSPGSYTVTLTVTSSSGCVAAVKSKTFTVNGAVPKAAFTAKNTTGGTGLCSGDDVLFDASASSVDFGSITRIDFFYDYANASTTFSTYTKSAGTIPTDMLFRHNYGLFNTPATKNYQVRMIAYSGASCISTPYDVTITIKANPVVTLSTLGAICQEASPVQITENKNGFSGTGVFSGTGISSTGLFNPATSGAGTFTISYTFTASNSCAYTTTQDVTVNATPKVSAGDDLHILEGGQATIAATASGDVPLTYKWTLANGGKATNLNHDDILNPITTPIDDISYMLTVTTTKGCTASSIVNITVLKAPVVPNTFTPNGDGVNDTWDIKYLDSYPNCTVDIFNRFGAKLYGSVGYPNRWDGTYKGVELPVGVYYYIINPKNGRKAISGSLTIIR